MQYKSVNGVTRIMKQLLKEGIIMKDENGVIVPGSLFNIPLKGTIPAGMPIFVDSEQDNSLDLYKYLLNLPNNVFCLSVRGDSMIDAGIFDGDIAYIDPARSARIGDIVAACIDNEWTLKYLAVDDDRRLCLKPANKKYPTLYPQEQLTIGGVLIRAARDY